MGKSNQAMPILTLLAYTVGTGFLINDLTGLDDTAASIAIALPVAGILNNASWSGAALQNASWNLNSALLEQNPNVDVFLNPKYDIQYEHGIFNQKAKVRARVMGATLLTND